MLHAVQCTCSVLHHIPCALKVVSTHVMKNFDRQVELTWAHTQRHVSQDQEPRSARVRIGNGKVIFRPLSLLYPIECPEVTQVLNPAKNT